MTDDSSDHDFPSDQVGEMAEKYGYRNPTGLEPITNWIEKLREKFTEK